MTIITNHPTTAQRAHQVLEAIHALDADLAELYMERATGGDNCAAITYTEGIRFRAMTELAGLLPA